jgi:hypothetical protein
MKYFTKKLYLAMQDCSDPDCLARVMRQWESRRKRYMESLESISSHLSKTTYRLLSDHAMHDDYLIGINVDYSELRRKFSCGKAAYWRPGRHFRIDIEITLLTRPNNLRAVRYHRVSRYTFDYPSGSPLGLEFCESMDMWKFDEMSYTGKELQHDILLASGAEIRIAAQRVTIRTLPRASGTKR